MQTLTKRLELLQKEIATATERLSIEEKKAKIIELNATVADSEIWINPENAQVKIKQLSQLNNLVEPWAIISAQVSDLLELIKLGDQTMYSEFESEISVLERDFIRLKKDLLFKGKYDSKNAILRLSAGVGGTDAQDFTEMLERMYLRWADKSKLATKVIERSAGEEAGIKSCVIEVDGKKQ